MAVPSLDRDVNAASITLKGVAFSCHRWFSTAGDMSAASAQLVLHSSVSCAGIVVFGCVPLLFHIAEMRRESVHARLQFPACCHPFHPLPFSGVLTSPVSLRLTSARKRLLTPAGAGVRSPPPRQSYRVSPSPTGCHRKCTSPSCPRAAIVRVGFPVDPGHTRGAGLTVAASWLLRDSSVGDEHRCGRHALAGARGIPPSPRDSADPFFPCAFGEPPAAGTISP